VIKFLGKK